MVRVQLCVLAGSLLVIPGTAGMAAQSIEPAQLFTDACTQGQVKLAKDAVRDTTYSRMPDAARAAVGLGAPLDPRRAPTLYSPLDPAQVPNRVLALSGQPVYLILPAASQNGALASSCAVVWKARDFAKARDALFAITHAPATATSADTSIVEDVHEFGLSGPDYRLRAVEIEGWTMLVESAAVMPAPTISKTSATPGMIARDKGNGETIVTTNHQ